MMQFFWFCAAGYSFFIGSAFLIAAIVFSVHLKKYIRNVLVFFLTFAGFALIWLSATPLPLLFYIVWVVSVLAAVTAGFIIKTRLLKCKTAFLVIGVLYCILGILLECRYQFFVGLPKDDFHKLYIIGDSVTAGIAGPNEKTWPAILRAEHNLAVCDFAQSGATVNSAIKQAKNVEADRSLVLLEIGGNDLFGPTPIDAFEKDLETIIVSCKEGNNSLIMLELPCFPWQTRYPKVQRKLARKYDIILIPKRFFVSVLSEKDASPDLAHLTESGHQEMAEMIWSLIENSVSPVSTE